MAPISRNILVAAIAVFGLQSSAFAVTSQHMSPAMDADSKYRKTMKNTKMSSTSDKLQVARNGSGFRTNVPRDDRDTCCVDGRCFPC